MPTSLAWSHQARQDLLDIYTLIGLDNPQAAERYVDRIEEKVGLLAMMPRLGVARPDIAAGLRMLVEAPYVIFYGIAPDDDDQSVAAVEIVRVVDIRRDLPNLF